VTDVEVVSEIRDQKFPSEWYDASEASHFWFRWRLAALRRALADACVSEIEARHVLDIGCGSGVLAAQLEDSTNWTVDGTDLNLRALERCRPRRGKTLYYDVTEERVELVGSYGAVILFDVLEHLPDPRALLRSALRHLAPGGLVLINVPALPALMSAYDREAGHLRRYTTQSLLTEVEGLGVSTCVLRYWGFSLVPLLLARKAMLARGGPRTIDRGFRPPAAAFNSALVGLMHLETSLVRQPPLGTSVLYVGVKSRS
jgi:SAM-dependent methyltransferase